MSNPDSGLSLGTEGIQVTFGERVNGGWMPEGEKAFGAMVLGGDGV